MSTQESSDQEPSIQKSVTQKSPTQESSVQESSVQKLIQKGKIPSGYELVTWPESQAYMGPGGPIMDGDAVLINSGPLFKKHGKAAYLIPEDRKRYTESGRPSD